MIQSDLQPIVSVQSLTKRFKCYHSPAGRLTEWLSFGTVRRHSLFTALDEISFTVRKGEFFGIVGPNGSGKSTLLKVLTGVLMPSAGSFQISGRVTSLLELGTGFNPELTGRENLINSGRLLGFNEADTRRRMDRIIDFAELAEQIDLPIKYYSTGMVVRLAFSLFAHIEPDVFIVDEALSVGDVGFSRKCFERLDKMRESGCTLLFCSHDLAAVRKYCDQAMFLYHGKCAFLGRATEATDLYLEAMSPGARRRGLLPGASALDSSAVSEGLGEEIEQLREQLPQTLASLFDEASFAGPAAVASSRIGTGAARIVAVKITDESGVARSRLASGQAAQFHVLLRAEEDFDRATASVQLVNRLGVVVWGTSHHRLTGQLLGARRGEWIHAVFSVRLDLGPDHFALDVAIGDAAGEGHVHDRLTATATLEVEVRSHLDFEGAARLPASCEVQMASTPAAAQRQAAVTSPS